MLYCPPSESSLFVAPHRVILKTCGTTLNLLGLPRILDIAKSYASLPTVYRCFYSRKAFMFPDRQSGPHRDWKKEVEYLDTIFPNGSAYTIGKMNGDHWLLYLTNPQDPSSPGSVPSSPSLDFHPLGAPEFRKEGPDDIQQDYTIEILMTHLSPIARDRFFPCPNSLDLVESDPSKHAQELSSAIGITELFPSEFTTLDAYSFSPCGYSSNALIKWRDYTSTTGGEGYYTIHVTPEEGWSYASFECNVPLPHHKSCAGKEEIPDLKTLIRRVVEIFQPGTLTLTLFMETSQEEGDVDAVEAAQRAFKSALTTPFCSPKPPNGDGNSFKGLEFNRVYKRTDKINYEFGGYDLAFATFELCL